MIATLALSVSSPNFLTGTSDAFLGRSCHKWHRYMLSRGKRAFDLSRAKLPTRLCLVAALGRLVLQLTAPRSMR